MTVLILFLDKGDRNGRNHDRIAECRQNVSASSPCGKPSSPMIPLNDADAGDSGRRVHN